MLSLELSEVSMINDFFLASVEKAFGISFVDIKQCHFPTSMQEKFTVVSLEQFCTINVPWVFVYF